MSKHSKITPVSKSKSWQSIRNHELNDGICIFLTTIKICFTMKPNLGKTKPAETPVIFFTYIYSLLLSAINAIMPLCKPYCLLILDWCHHSFVPPVKFGWQPFCLLSREKWNCVRVRPQVYIFWQTVQSSVSFQDTVLLCVQEMQNYSIKSI